jgi:hypothetical protein
VLAVSEAAGMKLVIGDICDAARGFAVRIRVACGNDHNFPEIEGLFTFGWQCGGSREVGGRCVF